MVAVVAAAALEAEVHQVAAQAVPAVLEASVALEAGVQVAAEQEEVFK